MKPQDRGARIDCVSVLFSHRSNLTVHITMARMNVPLTGCALCWPDCYNHDASQSFTRLIIQRTFSSLRFFSSTLLLVISAICGSARVCVLAERERDYATERRTNMIIRNTQPLLLLPLDAPLFLVPVARFVVAVREHRRQPGGSQQQSH